MASLARHRFGSANRLQPTQSALLSNLLVGKRLFNLNKEPLVHKLVSTVPMGQLKMVGAAAAGGGAAVEFAPVAVEETFQYYWMARRPSERVVDACMVKVETNRDGEVLRTQVLVTS